MNRAIGLALLVAGSVLFYFGWQSSQSVGDQLTEAFTGSFTDQTMWFLIGGIAAVVAGAYLLIMRK